jgi:hypothetical protein
MNPKEKTKEMMHYYLKELLSAPHEMRVTVWGVRFY